MGFYRLHASQKKVAGDNVAAKVLNSKAVNDILKFIVSFGLGLNILLLGTEIGDDTKTDNVSVAALCAMAIAAQLIRNAHVGNKICKDNQR